MSCYASPTITLEDWAAGRRSDVDVFEDQLKGWIFDQAQILADSPNPHCGPAILALITPYFELITAYKKGERSQTRTSTQFLRDGINEVLPLAKPDAVDLYVKEVRNGFAHEALFRNVKIHRVEPGFELSDGTLAVNPWWLLGKLKAHFEGYVAKLRSGAEAEVNRNFEKFMDVRKRG